MQRLTNNVRQTATTITAITLAVFAVGKIDCIRQSMTHIIAKRLCHRSVHNLWNRNAHDARITPIGLHSGHTVRSPKNLTNSRKHCCQKNRRRNRVNNCRTLNHIEHIALHNFNCSFCTHWARKSRGRNTLSSDLRQTTIRSREWVSVTVAATTELRRIHVPL